jgi:hypothetical protein
VYAAGGTVVTVTLATGVTGARLESPMRFWTKPLAWLALLLPVGLLRKRRRSWLLVLLVGLVGCSTVGRTIPAGGGGGGTTPPVVTPSGSYTIVVAGSSAGFVSAVNLTLVVQ